MKYLFQYSRGCIKVAKKFFCLFFFFVLADFPDWAIAVIVVGVLAVVALVFCFIGICFACNTGKSDENACKYSGFEITILQVPNTFVVWWDCHSTDFEQNKKESSHTG